MSDLVIFEFQIGSFNEGFEPSTLALKKVPKCGKRVSKV